MRNIEALISPLVSSQFPSFYQEEGPLFIEFVKAYYQWMETSGQQTSASRNLLNYADIDKTTDAFLVHLKEMFLKDLPLDLVVDERLLLKHILEIYTNKGNEQGVELILRSLFGVDSSVYLPSKDIFKTSYGKWIKPKYVEVSVSPRNTSYINREIQGTLSGAKALCESVTRKRINGKYIDVMYLSNVRGNFSYGEQVVETANTSTINAPSVTGSLTTLDVLNGGQNFAVGNEFNVVSNSGKNAKAIVTSISSQTGRVNFLIEDGGFGYSTTANVYISDKILRVSDKTNSNTSITDYSRFETASQQLMRVGFSSAVNAAFFKANTILFAQGNSTVANATAGIVAANLTSNTVGYVIVNNISGNIAATNTVIKASLVDLVYTASNSALFTTNSVIESVNSTANASAIVLSTATTNSTHGTLLIRPVTGNVASTNTTIRLASNNAVTATINTYSSNLYYTAVVANNADVTASGTVIGTNTSYVGLDSVLNTFYSNTQYSYLVGQTSNTYGYFSFVSSGSDASFKVSSLDNEENVLISEFLAANNTGSVPFMDINLDLSPNNANATGYGFTKYPGASINTIILDALTFDSKTIGTISSLGSINPGTDYNIDPFVLVYEKGVATHARKDFVIEISNPTRLYVVGEKVQQTSNSAAVQLTVNNFSGTAANGSSTSSFTVGEYVYQSNGSANIATGFVYSSGLSNGAGSVKLYNVTGAFETTPSHGYQIRTVTSNATANATAVNTGVTISTTAYGIVDQGSNSSVLFVKRLSFENTFGIGNTLIGVSSGASSNISNIYEQTGSLSIGENAVISANVQVSNAVVSGLSVIDSGYGYIDGENVTLEIANSQYIVTAKANLLKQGVGEGYYATTDGFLSSDKRLIDSDYYQDYSYEIQTRLPFQKYADVLKKVAHVAGTKMFGKVIVPTNVNLSTSVSSEIDIS